MKRKALLQQYCEFNREKAEDDEFLETLRKLKSVSPWFTILNILRRLKVLNAENVAKRCWLQTYKHEILQTSQRVYLYKSMHHGSLIYNGLTQERLDTGDKTRWPFVAIDDPEHAPPNLPRDVLCVMFQQGHLNVRDACSMMRLSKHYRDTISNHMPMFWSSLLPLTATQSYQSFMNHVLGQVRPHHSETTLIERIVDSRNDSLVTHLIPLQSNGLRQRFGSCSFDPFQVGQYSVFYDTEKFNNFLMLPELNNFCFQFSSIHFAVAYHRDCTTHGYRDSCVVVYVCHDDSGHIERMTKKCYEHWYRTAQFDSPTLVFRMNRYARELSQLSV